MVQSVERAFAVLGALGRGPAGVTAIATRLALPKSTVSRMLSTLEELDAVERTDDARYRIGPGVAALAAGAEHPTLAALVHPHLEALVEALGEDAGLALPEGHAVRYVDQVESANAVQVRDWTGERAPLHTVPSGLLLLASWPAAALDDYLAHPLERRTRHTVVDPAAIRRRLEDVRRGGVAWGREEFAEGITSVAAPLRDARGEVVAAIHVHGPSYRFPPPGEEDAVAAGVTAAAAAISGELARLG